MDQNFYEKLVMQTQVNYQNYFNVYAQGGTPIKLSEKKPLSYEQQITVMADKIKAADHIVVGGAQVCQLLAEGISIMKIMIRSKSILANF